MDTNLAYTETAFSTDLQLVLQQAEETPTHAIFLRLAAANTNMTDSFALHIWENRVASS
jgi:hypothetical protein